MSGLWPTPQTPRKQHRLEDDRPRELRAAMTTLVEDDGHLGEPHPAPMSLPGHLHLKGVSVGDERGQRQCLQRLPAPASIACGAIDDRDAGDEMHVLVREPAEPLAILRPIRDSPTRYVTGADHE